MRGGACATRSGLRLLVQLHLQRVEPVREIAKQIGQIRVVDGLAGFVKHKVLLRDVSDVITLIILGEKVVKGLVLGGAAVLGDGIIPFLRVGKDRVHIKDHTAKRVFAVPDNLAKVVFRNGLQHGPVIRPRAGPVQMAALIRPETVCEMRQNSGKLA
jgi:hypothetical protein